MGGQEGGVTSSLRRLQGLTLSNPSHTPTCYLLSVLPGKQQVWVSHQGVSLKLAMRAASEAFRSES